MEVKKCTKNSLNKEMQKKTHWHMAEEEKKKTNGKRGCVRKYVNYKAFYNKLNQNKEEKRYFEWLNTEILPYNIPSFYSLDIVAKDIGDMEKRLDVIADEFGKSDMEAIALDWEKIGEDINEAIYKFGRDNIGKAERRGKGTFENV